MTNRGKYAFVFLLIGLVLLAGVGVGWWAVSRFHAPGVKFVLRGSSGSSGRLKVSGGNLAVVTPRPGVFFGTVKKPDAAEEFTYVILFRYGRPKPDGTHGHGVQFHCTSDARTAATTDAIDLDGKRIEAAYRVELDETLASVASESLIIGGKRVDPTVGRVFLIDLAAEGVAPTYRQTTADLPPVPANLQTPADVERLADAVRQSLERQGAEFRAFLR